MYTVFCSHKTNSSGVIDQNNYSNAITASLKIKNKLITRELIQLLCFQWMKHLFYKNTH